MYRTKGKCAKKDYKVSILQDIQKCLIDDYSSKNSDNIKVNKATRPHISKSLRSLVWDKDVGLDKGYTMCLCGIKIYQVNFECGHIIPHSKGGETVLNNLRPICGMCNKSMGNVNFDVYEKQLCVIKEYSRIIFILKSSANTAFVIGNLVGKIIRKFAQWSVAKIYSRK